MSLKRTVIMAIAAWITGACGPPSCPCEAREGHEAAGGARQVQEGVGAKEKEADREPASAAEGTQAEAVKEALLELFRHCNSGEDEKAAAYIVYRGSDEKGAWKRTCNYADPDERDQVEGVCAGIKGYLHKGGNPEFLEFTTETESEGQWLVWKVRFILPDETPEAYFAFLRVGEGYALGDID